jgi:hypothetical protein
MASRSAMLQHFENTDNEVMGYDNLPFSVVHNSTSSSTSIIMLATKKFIIELKQKEQQLQLKQQSTMASTQKRNWRTSKHTTYRRMIVTSM